MPRATRFSCPRPSRTRAVAESYCFVTSLRATVFSSPLDNLTVTLPSFSSTLTTVASLDDPLDLTFTLSPALNCGVVGVLVAGAGDACSLAPVFGVAAAKGWSFRLAGALFSVVEPESQAARKIAKSTTAKSFVVIVFLHSWWQPLFQRAVSDSSLGEWRLGAKHFTTEVRILCGLDAYPRSDQELRRTFPGSVSNT